MNGNMLGSGQVASRATAVGLREGTQMDELADRVREVLDRATRLHGLADRLLGHTPPAPQAVEPEPNGSVDALRHLLSRLQGSMDVLESRFANFA